MRQSILLLLLLPLFATAQKLPSIEEKINGLKKYEGYFTFYWDENTGKVWLEVDKLETEFLYVVSLPSGLGSNDIGLDRGLLGEDRVVKLQLPCVIERCCRKTCSRTGICSNNRVGFYH
jgi:Domain of unknown function (DUF5118)